ncbi:MAG: hypothetical protein Ct9H300mP14_00110 [Gammaproteobacteria bacterium]|nr:MAG: hypothetical protein Ct9H300mP14_00110 [Gammaproteobacteria bacterium]
MSPPCAVFGPRDLNGGFIVQPSLIDAITEPKGMFCMLMMSLSQQVFSGQLPPTTDYDDFNSRKGSAKKSLITFSPEDVKRRSRW